MTVPQPVTDHATTKRRTFFRIGIIIAGAVLSLLMGLVSILPASKVFTPTLETAGASFTPVEDSGTIKIKTSDKALAVINPGMQCTLTDPHNAVVKPVEVKGSTVIVQAWKTPTSGTYTLACTKGGKKVVPTFVRTGAENHVIVNNMDSHQIIILTIAAAIAIAGIVGSVFLARKLTAVKE